MNPNKTGRLAADNLRPLPEQATDEQKRLLGEDTLSLLNCPVVADDRLLGYVCLQQCGESRPWPREHQQLLASLAETP